MTREQRVELERGIEASTEAAARLFERHSSERLKQRPRADAWSAAECIVHLNLTSAALVPLLQAAIRGLREKGLRRDEPSGMDWMGRLLRWSLEPRFLRVKTAAGFVPQKVEPFAEVLPEFRRQQDALVSTLRSAEGFDLGAAKISSPFDARAHYNVLSAFRIVETHARRHLRQAEAAVEAGAQR